MLVRFTSAISVFGVLDDERMVRARVSGNGRFAALAAQDETSVYVEVVESHRLIASILGLLPATRPFPGRLVKVLDDEPGFTRDDEAARRMLAVKRERAGYFTAHGLDRHGHAVRSPELAWTDTVKGRFVSRSRTAGDGTRFTTHEPGSYPTLVTALRELVGWVRADGR